MDYPQPAGFSFMLAIADGSPGSGAIFAEASGVSAALTGNPVVEGGENRFVHKLPGARTNSNLVLKRGMIAQASPLADWIAQAVGATFATPIVTRTLALALADADGEALIRWTFAGAWPVKWEVSSIAEDGAVVVESLEFAYASMARS